MVNRSTNFGKGAYYLLIALGGGGGNGDSVPKDVCSRRHIHLSG
jgi:hypothetical protein